MLVRLQRKRRAVVGFPPLQLLRVARRLLSAATDPRDALDALMGALNLARFLFSDCVAARRQLALPPAPVAVNSGSQSAEGASVEAAPAAAAADLAGGAAPSRTAAAAAKTAAAAALLERAEALPADAVRQLHEQLEALDLRLRRCMDEEWSACSRETEGFVPDSAHLPFTELQVVLDILDRTRELCAEHKRARTADP